MLSTTSSKLRDWGLFVLAALLPAAAIGLLGLRALLNEEAAIKREMRVVLEQSAETARRQFETTLGELDTATLSAAPFADHLSLPADAIQPRPQPSTGKSKRQRQDDCDNLARQLRSGKEPTTARKAILDGCEAAQTSTGRMLWIVVALSKDAAIPRARLEKWLREHGPALSVAERAATRLELDAAAWLDEPDRAALSALLSSDPEQTSTAPLPSAQRYAMRTGRARISWSEAGSRGLLTRQPDGSYEGYVVHPTSVARALQGGWPRIQSDITARLVIGNKPATAVSFEVLEAGAHIDLAYADPSAVETRTQRSKRILLGVAALAVVIAIALAALLFSRMRAERRVSALRTDFVAAVSHELRTPIASIRMLSELLADGSIDDAAEQTEMHEALAREAKRLGDTVNRLLGFSRMEAGKDNAKLTVSPVATPVREAVATALERHPDTTIDETLDEDIEAPIDAEALKMAVTNLLSNALKYGKPPYRVRVAREGKGVRVDVEDGGPGLDKRDQRRIFRPFERADDRLSEATEGSGIGLSLVSHVARSHHGRAGVDSELGRGSTFYLWLPIEQTQERSRG